MKKYIDKEALVAEIDRIENGLMDAQGNFAYREDEGAYHTLCSLENFINSLEVKEVDLDDKGEWKNTGGFGSTWDPDSPNYCPD